MPFGASILELNETIPELVFYSSLNYNIKITIGIHGRHLSDTL